MYVTLLSVLASVTTATPIDRASWFSAGDYPIEAMRKGLQGAVTFEVDVGLDGKPSACRITKSSGEPILDQTTCDLIRARARFKPALDAVGKPIVGKYSTQAIWKLPAASMQTFHHAVMLDFSMDPDHPECRVESTFPALGNLPTCEQTLAQTSFIAALGKRLVRAVILVAAAARDEQPYKGEPGWGTRLSFLANEQYRVNGPVPLACLSVAAEGLAAGQDACRSLPGAKSLTDAQKKDAYKIGRLEISTFGVARPPEQHANGCRNGESAAESSGCD